jgi:hypothetical protein
MLFPRKRQLALNGRDVVKQIIKKESRNRKQKLKIAYPPFLLCARKISIASSSKKAIHL